MKKGSLIALCIFINGCSIYQEEDYGEHRSDSMENLADKYQAICGGMSPDEKARCIKDGQNLSVKSGADKSCDYDYQYQKNNCIKNKSKQKELLDQSLEKHIK